MQKYISIFLGITLLLMGISGYIYFKYSQSKIEELTTEVTAARITIKSQEAVIKDAEERALKYKKYMEEYQSSVIDINERYNNLQKYYSSIDINLESIRKPKEMELKANEDMKKMLEDFEKISRENFK